MAKWLVKNEVDSYSISDLARDKRTIWEGVRNYQARNYLRQMKVGDQLLFYHSNGDPSGVAGIAKVTKTAVADPTQFELRSKYFDPKATPDAPRWFAPEVGYVRKFKEILPLSKLKKVSALKNLPLLQRGTRLSVHPVTESQFRTILELAE